MALGHIVYFFIRGALPGHACVVGRQAMKGIDFRGRLGYTGGERNRPTHYIHCAAPYYRRMTPLCRGNKFSLVVVTYEEYIADQVKAFFGRYSSEIPREVNVITGVLLTEEEDSTIVSSIFIPSP